MKLHIDELSQERTIILNGTEPWLSEIYHSFPHPTLELQPKLQGEFHLLLEDAGTVKVDGSISYQPFIDCGRCSRPIQWQVSESIHTRFLPADWQPQEREHKLSRSELDDYFLNNGWLDLEELVNDMVQTNIPMHAVQTDENSNTCAVCHEDTSDALVFGAKVDLADPEGEQKTTNPFAVLKGLKLKD